MARQKYKKGMFEKGKETLIADEVEIGMIIALSKNKYFYIDDIEKFFINDKVGKLYGDNDPVKPEHTKITFYDEDDNSIIEIPGTECCISFKRVDGKHSSITKEDEEKSRQLSEKFAIAMQKAFKDFK